MARTSDAADAALIEAEVREGHYGAKVAAVEPGGAEFIPLSERHGKPLQLFWTWMSPNMEFATIFVGVIGVWFFGQSFWHGDRWRSCSAPRSARCPWASSPPAGRSSACRRWCCPGSASASSATSCPPASTPWSAGIGWFAVNSVSGAFALNALLGWQHQAVPADHRDRRRSPSRSSATTWCTPSSAGRSRSWSSSSRSPRWSSCSKAHPGAARGRRARAAGCSRSARPSATRPAGTRTPPTTPATSRRTPTAGPPGCGGGRRVRLLHRCWRSSARPRRRSPTRQVRRNPTAAFTGRSRPGSPT